MREWQKRWAKIELCRNAKNAKNAKQQLVRTKPVKPM